MPWCRACGVWAPVVQQCQWVLVWDGCMVVRRTHVVVACGVAACVEANACGWVESGARIGMGRRCLEAHEIIL